MKIAELLSMIEEPYRITNGDLVVEILNFKAIRDGEENSLCFIDKNRTDVAELLKNTKSNVVLCASDSSISEKSKCIIYVDDPKVTFAQIVLKSQNKERPKGIHSTAVIHPEATIHPTAYIGPFCVIGKSTVKSNSFLHSHITIYDDVIIGEDTQIQAGTMIGAEGFGYLKDKNGKVFNFPHIGKVVIGSGVQIGTNVSIDRGSLSDTVIHANVFIDNNVHIAHNVVIESNSFIIANSMIGGSVHIAKNCWISPGAMIRDQLTIGENALIGLGAVVTKNVPPNEVWLGNPAQEISRFRETKSK